MISETWGNRHDPPESKHKLPKGLTNLSLFSRFPNVPRVILPAKQASCDLVWYGSLAITLTTNDVGL
ncbi:hypothetical protein EYR41_000353 [Orbilia oligospora]|uniref:Uncharacterized protein n=1 Tax=Orbilia oligospora TaxID=2813651 RepID=A0A8H2HNW4_ORBOL|nr:hypothetical protein TWF128_002529 [Orbilia oligospora]TGJ73244.1 hypothetical protein EYR41_000353 [Orbilia oligospora]